MAISGFAATPNLLRLGSAVVSGVPLSMACWVNPATIGVFQAFLGVYASGAANTLQQFGLTAASTNLVRAFTGAATTAQATSTSPLAANVWTHIGGVFSAINSRTVYFNGAAQATDTTSLTPMGLNRTSIGNQDNLDNGRPATGPMAECGIWDIALSATDMATLALGVSPMKVRPDALVLYAPLRTVDNLVNYMGSPFSVVGSLASAAHPRIFMPGRREVI